MTSIKKIACLAMVLSTLALGACDTMHGAGEDISHGGDAVQRAAQ